MIKTRIEDFLKTYGDRIFNSGSEVEYWKIVTACLEEEGLLDKKDVEIIEKFLLHEENSLFSEERVLTESEKGKLLVEMLAKILESERIFREKETADYGEDGRTWLENRKNAGICEDEYISAYYTDVRKYYVLYEMYQYKIDMIKETLESRATYKQYSSCTGFLGEYYCHSPILEIITGNINLVGLHKKRPENMSDKAEYEYDENGRLLIIRRYWNEEKLYSCEYLLYAEEWLMNLYYDNRNSISYITLRFYENVISSYECACLTSSSNSLDGMCTRMNKESYKYSDKEILEKSVAEEYNFPKLEPSKENRHELLLRTKMSFEGDEEGIIGFWIQDYIGDKPRHEPGYVPLSERRKKIAKKTRGRWKRPDYFIR